MATETPTVATEETRGPQVKRPITDLQREHLATARRVKRQKREARDSEIDFYLRLNRENEKRKKPAKKVEEKPAEEPTEERLNGKAISPNNKPVQDSGDTTYWDNLNVRAVTKWGLYLAGTIFVSYMAKQVTGKRDNPDQPPTTERNPLQVHSPYG